MHRQKEPLFHIVKRGAISPAKALGIRSCAIILALVVCALITTLTTGYNPIEVYGAMIKGALGSSRKAWVTFQNVALLLIVALAVTPAFKMRYWNVGGEGQIMVGCLASSACMITMAGRVPNAVVIIVEILAAIAAGAIWALIPAIFKAKWNTNETLFTLMMNYVATQLVAYFVIIWEVPKGSGTIGIINQKTQIGWLSLGNKYLLPIVVAGVLMVAVYIYMNYSKHGYEISVVGESERTARYVGIKVERVIIRTLAISGAICGICGLLLSCGINHTLTTSLSDGRGFTAVMVSWLAKFNPFVMVLSSFLLVFLDRGANEIATAFSLNQSFSDILTGIILFFIIGCEFFINYQFMFRKSAKKEEHK